MQELDSKKIYNALKSLENAGKGAVRALNEMTDNEFRGSQLETDPLGNLGLIVRVLQNAQQKATANAKYVGMSPDEVADAKAQELIEEAATIQQRIQDKLAAREVKPEPETELEPLTISDPVGNPDDVDQRPEPQY